LLPLSLSWDADWYYGRDFEPDAAEPGAIKPEPTATSGGKR